MSLAVRPKLLLVEEDATFANELQTGLRQVGCDVTLLREGGAGLARAVSESFDLIVLSAELPGMNGFRVCNRIKKDEATKAVPVFLMSASQEGFDAHELLATKADSYFRKPVVVRELLARARMYVPALGRAENTPTELQSLPKPSAPPLPGRVVDTLPPTESLEEISVVDYLPASDKLGRLEKELAAAHGELDATAALRAKLREQEETIAKLAKDLAEARAAVWRARAPATSPPPGRELLDAKAKEVAQLKADLAAEQHAHTATRQSQEHLGRERDAHLARNEKLLLAARADKELVAKRSEDHARRADRNKALSEELRKELAETNERRAGAEERLRALEEQAALRERGRVELERSNEALATKIREDEERALRLRAEHEAAIELLRSEVTDRERAFVQLDAGIAAREETHEKRIASLERELDLERGALARERESQVELQASGRAALEAAHAEGARRARALEEELGKAREEAASKASLAAHALDTAREALAAEQAARVAIDAAHATTTSTLAAVRAEKELADTLATSLRAAHAADTARLREGHRDVVLELERKLAGQEARSKEELAAAARARDEAAQQHERALTALRTTAEATTAQHAGAIAALESAHAARLEEQLKASEAKLDRVRAELAAAHVEDNLLASSSAEQRMRRAHETVLGDLRAEHLRTRAETEEGFRVEREGLATQHQQALAAERARGEQAADRARAEAQALVQKTQADVATTEKKHAEELGFLHSRHADLEAQLAEMATNTAATAAHAKALEESLRASGEQGTAALMEHRAATEARHAEDLAARDRRHGEAVAELEERVRSARTEGRHAQEALRREHEAALGAVVAETRGAAQQERLQATEALAAADTAAAAMRADRVQLEAAHAKEKAALHAQVEGARSEADTRVASAHTEHARTLQAARDAHAQEVAKLRGTWDEALEKLERDLVQSRAIGAHKAAALNELQDRFERTQKRWEEEATTATGARLASERTSFQKEQKQHELAMATARAEADAAGRRLASVEAAMAQERHGWERERAAHATALAAVAEEQQRERAEATARMTHRAESANKLREELDATHRKEAAASAAAGALRGALEAMKQQLERAQGEVLAAQQSRAGSQATLDSLRAEQAEAARSLRAELEAKLAEAHGRAAGSERLVKEARMDADARARELEASLQASREDQARALEAAKAGAAVALATELEAAAVTREKAVADARAAARAEASQERAHALEEQATDLRAAADEKREAAIRDVRGELERALDAERAQLEARIRELTAQITERDAARERERAAAQGALVPIAALEALVASRTEEVERVVVELEEARAELPALEAEIVVLRSDLMSVRRQLDQQVTASIASEAQLARDRTLLSRAAETILELKAHFGPAKPPDR